MKSFRQFLAIACLMLFHSSYLLAQTDMFWSNRGIGGGGTFFSPSINPANNQEYYVSSDMSEVFHTTDFGANYQLVDFRQIQGFHYSKVCFTHNGVLYAISYADDATRVVRSQDGGHTFDEVEGSPEDELFGIFVDYQNPNRVLVAGYSDVYYSVDAGVSFASIYHSDASNGLIVSGVLFDGDNVFVGTSEGVLISATAGSVSGNWEMNIFSGFSSEEEKIFSFAAAKEGNSIRFYCITAANAYPDYPSNEYYGFPLGVYVCDFQGSESVWLDRQANLNLADSDFPLHVAMAENEIDVAYLGGSNSNGMPTVYKTTTGGDSWSNTFFTTNNANITTGWSGYRGDRGWWYGEVVFGIAVAPNNSEVVVFGDYGFVHNTSDGGGNWQQAYVSKEDAHAAGTATVPRSDYQSIGLENTSSWQVIWTSEMDMFAAYSDIRGIRSVDGGQKWSYNYEAPDANTMYRIAQHPSGALFAATSGVHDMYMSTQLSDRPLDNPDDEGNIIYSSDHGSTWRVIKSFNHPVFWIALDPNNPSIAYASVIHYDGGNGVGGIYRCNNLLDLEQAVWEPLPNPPRTQKHPASLVVLNDGSLVCTYSGRRTSAGFTNSSGVFHYDPVTNTWQDKSDPQMVYWTKDIIIDPHDPNQNTWYVGVFSGWGGFGNTFGGLFRTTDRGVTWTKLSALHRVSSCTISPVDSDLMFVTTEEDGLFVSNNATSNSPSLSEVSSYKFRQPERVFFNPHNTNEVWVTNFGHGLTMASLEESSRQVQTISFDELPSKTYGDEAFALDASASSGLPVSYISSDVSIAQISGNSVHIAGAGNCTISAVQNGDAHFSPAPAVQRTLVVNKAEQSISFELADVIPVQTEPIILNELSSAGLPITYTSNNEQIARIEGNQLYALHPGLVVIGAEQLGDANHHAAQEVFREVQVEEILGIKEASIDISIYPNPSNGLFQISGMHYPPALPVRLILPDGKEVRKDLKEKDGHYLLDLTGMPEGIYIVYLNQLGYRIVKK